MKVIIYGGTGPLIDAWDEDIALLLEKGAATEAVESNGRTPLYWAAERRHEVVVRLRDLRMRDICVDDPSATFPHSICE